jgi:hypothetical protein
MRRLRSPRFAVRGIALAALVLSSAALPAFAQEPPAAPTPAQLAEAKTHMQAGAAFYNDPSGHKCEEAYREFKQAYDLSGSHNALKGMGVCALELERDGDAIDHYERFLEKATSIAPADRTQVETDLKTLKAAVAWVTIQADRPNVKLADVRTPSKGFPVSNHYTASKGATKLGIHPGEHVFTASVDGEPDQVWKVEISNGATYSHSFSFGPGKGAAAVVAPVPPPKAAEPKPAEPEPAAKPPEEPPAPTGEKYRPTPAAVWVFGGLTVALAVPTAIFMVVAKGKNNDYKAVNGTLAADELRTKHDAVKSANLVADIFLGATAASLVTTGIIYLARPTKTKEKASATTFHVVPTFGPEGGGAAALGTF